MCRLMLSTARCGPKSLLRLNEFDLAAAHAIPSQVFTSRIVIGQRRPSPGPCRPLPALRSPRVMKRCTSQAMPIGRQASSPP